jgi:hypothetical protein
MRIALLVILLMFLIGCDSKPVSPEKTYRAYIARSAEGMSFDEELDFWSEEKIAQLDERLESLMQRSGRTREKAIELYMDVSKRTAKCTALELVSKEVVQSTANIIFAATDTCGDESDTRHNIQLVLEQEWKLDEVEVVF